MNTITFEVRSPDDAFDDVIQSLESHSAPGSASVSFATPELLRQILNPDRWQILKLLCERERISVAEIAQQIGRDINAVHIDIEALSNAGIVSHHKDVIRFPYDQINIEPSTATSLLQRQDQGAELAWIVL